MKISVIGAGYVGMANALLLAKSHKIVCVDSSATKVSLINSGKSPIEENEAQDALEKRRANISASCNLADGCKGAKYIIFSLPTDFDNQTNSFNTSVLEDVMTHASKISPAATFIVRSTVPIGFTSRLARMIRSNEIIFVPEFLREGRSFYDALNPSRIILGTDSNTKLAIKFGRILDKETKNKNNKIITMGSAEAEAVKLFANTYLAMRISFFNEMDTFAQEKSLNSRHLIEGISSDPRIGDYYNNPSFGYGGYCLPKDTKQLLSNYDDIPHSLISAIVSSNNFRKEYIAQKILSLIDTKASVVGIFRLVMKSGSDNFRESAILDILERLSNADIAILIFEPNLDKQNVLENINCEIVNDIKAFKLRSDLILANRNDQALKDVSEKVFSRDLFNTS